MFEDPLAVYLDAEWISGMGTEAVLLRFLIAIILGAVIGWERSSKRHSAGLRTFILAVVSGTGVMTLDCILQQGAKGGFYLLSAAYLIAVTHLSTIAVFHTSRNEIKGLTTAAAMQAAALLGLLLGRGLYLITLTAFVALMITIAWFPSFEAYLKNRSNHFEIHLELTNSVYLQDFVSTIRRLGLTIDEIELNRAYSGSGLSVYSISISISSGELKKYKTHTEIIEALRSLDYIYHIEEMHV